MPDSIVLLLILLAVLIVGLYSLNRKLSIIADVLFSILNHLRNAPGTRLELTNAEIDEHIKKEEERRKDGW